jgi:hypothetical protein
MASFLAAVRARLELRAVVFVAMCRLLVIESIGSSRTLEQATFRRQCLVRKALVVRGREIVRAIAARAMSEPM